MFFLKDMERNITIHPQMFGPRTLDVIAHKLKEDVEGTNMGNYYIISVMTEMQTSEGRIVPGSGYAEYTINYRAVVWRPFKGEVVSTIQVSPVPSPSDSAHTTRSWTPQ